MKKLRSFLLLLLLLVVVTGAAGAASLEVRLYRGGSYHAQSVTPVALTCDGQPLTADVPAFLLDSRTMVPVRVVSEQLGAAVTWNQERQQVLIENASISVTLTIGSAQAVVNGAAVSLYDGVPATLAQLDGKTSTMVPLRFVSDQLGAEVAWDAATYTAAITTVTEQNYDVSLPAVEQGAVVVHAAEEPRIFELPGRVVADFPGGVLQGGSFGTVPVDGAAVKSVRYNQYDTGYQGVRRVARVVLDLAEGLSLADLHVTWADGVLTAAAPGQEPPAEPDTPELPDTPAEEPELPPLVVLDAGHGGTDHGAIYHDISEKDVDLAITLQTGALLEAAGFRVHYTRTDDTTVTLAERAEQANLLDADIFVCIHANAFPQKPEINGLETYYLVGGDRSKVLASHIQQRVLEQAGITDRGIRTANFYVLKNTIMPAVLVETGYLTNVEEAALLTTEAHQARLAAGIAAGVADYFAAAASLEAPPEE